jgi:hypothetical protein
MWTLTDDQAQCLRSLLREKEVAMSGSVRLCWRCGKNTWAGQPCVRCAAPEEPACPECRGPADDRVMVGMKCGPCAYH